MLFDFLDNRRVVPNARVKAEISIVDPAQSNWFDRTMVDAICQLLDGEYRIVRHSQGARKDVGASAGKYPQRGVGASEPCSYLVQRAVAAVTDNDVNTPAGRILREPRGMAATIGLDDFNLVPAR